jgi:hypothetical protein
MIGPMPKKAEEIQFQETHRTQHVKRIMDGFVDDTTMWQNLPNGLDFISQGFIEKIAKCRTLVGTTPACHRRAARIAQVFFLSTSLGFVVKLSHGWLPIGDAKKSRPFLTCTAARTRAP